MIITAGNVSDEEINEVYELIKDRNYNYEFVSVYIIGDKGDMSIGAPFIEEYLINNILKNMKLNTEYNEMDALNKEDMMILEKIEEYDTYSDFMNNYQIIKNAVQTKYIGILQNKELEFKLKTLFNNIEEKQKNTISKEFIQRKNILIGMAQVLLRKPFTIEIINAEISSYMKNSENKESTYLINQKIDFFKIII